MALSLDYIGRFVIMTVAIAVAISLILTFRGDIVGTTPTPGEDNDISTEVVTIDTTSDWKSEVKQYTKLCYEKGQKRAETFICFVLSAETGGPFTGQVKDFFDNSFFGTIQNKNDNVNCNTVNVKYKFTTDGVVLTDYDC